MLKEPTYNAWKQFFAKNKTGEKSRLWRYEISSSSTQWKVYFKTFQNVVKKLTGITKIRGITWMRWCTKLILFIGRDDTTPFQIETMKSAGPSKCWGLIKNIKTVRNKLCVGWVKWSNKQMSFHYFLFYPSAFERLSCHRGEIAPPRMRVALVVATWWNFGTLIWAEVKGKALSEIFQTWINYYQ